MIINKKYVRENYPKGYKYLYFISYLNLDLIFFKFIRVGFGLSLQAQHLIGRKRDEATRYI